MSSDDPCDSASDHPCHVCICTRARVPLPSRVELVSENGSSHDGDGDGLHRLEDGGEERASPVYAPDLQSKRDARRHQTLHKKRTWRFQSELEQELRCTCSFFLFCQASKVAGAYSV